MCRVKAAAKHLGRIRYLTVIAGTFNGNSVEPCDLARAVLIPLHAAPVRGKVEDIYSENKIETSTEASTVSPLYMS